MAAKRVIKEVHVVPMGMANAYLIEGDDGLTLIDAGYPGKEAAVTRIISAAPQRSCTKLVRGPACTPSTSRWPRVEELFAL